MKKFIKHNRAQILFIFILFLGIGLLMKTNLFYFNANIFANIKAPPYNGLTLPIKKVPNWMSLSPDQWKLNYNSIPTDKLIPLPIYNPTDLAKNFESLNLNTVEGKKIRNEQLTYPVPYMGDYKLDGIEYAGSHLAVDIKTPIGSPVYAIGNGVVVKVSHQVSGFGTHICLRHDNFPSFDNPNLKATYYSCYNHLSETLVNEGQIVKKGELIAKSGETGTATTPHLHFQIDKSTAPWHPYWPFTTAEANAAGLNFFDAINAGLGRDKAIATTINPLIYIQKYIGITVSSSGTNSNTNTSNNSSTNSNTSSTNSNTSSTNSNNSSTNSNNSTHTNISTNNANIATPVIVSIPPVVSLNTTTTDTAHPHVNTDIVQPVVKFGKLDLKYDKNFSLNTIFIVKVVALDKNNNVISNFKPNSEINLKIDSGSAKLTKAYLTAEDFHNGIAQFTINPQAGYGLKFSVLYNGKTYNSDILQMSIFADLNRENKNYVAIRFLKNEGIVRGYSDGEFKPNQNVSRVEALKMIYEGLNIPVNMNVNLVFKDTDSKSWYARYVAAASREGIVQGYPGDMFKPENPVTRAEFIKMLELTAGYDLVNLTISNKPYDDVAANSWYAKYIYFAKEKGLLDDNVKNINPNQDLTRAEVADILYRMIVVKIANTTKFNMKMMVSSQAVTDFYKNQLT